KSFPKVTSLIAGGRQEMVRIEEFQGKIDAARAARKDKDLVLVARSKALIALVPTAYPQMTVARVRELRKIGLLIWGNHAVRASVGAMRKTFAQIRKDGGIHGVEG